MAVKIRIDGSIWCAALSVDEHGDMYVTDELHYFLSVEKKILVTQKCRDHVSSGGQWWWKGEEPENINIDPFYLT